MSILSSKLYPHTLFLSYLAQADLEPLVTRPSLPPPAAKIVLSQEPFLTAFCSAFLLCFQSMTKHCFVLLKGAEIIFIQYFNFS